VFCAISVFFIWDSFKECGIKLDEMWFVTFNRKCSWTHFISEALWRIARCLFKPVVLKVVDIDSQGSTGPSKGSINSYVVEWGPLNNCRVYWNNETSNSKLLLFAVQRMQTASIVLSKFWDCVLFYHAFQVKSTDIYFDTYFPCISNIWTRPWGLQKILYFNWGWTCRKVWEHLV